MQPATFLRSKVFWIIAVAAFFLLGIAACLMGGYLSIRAMYGLATPNAKKAEPLLGRWKIEGLDKGMIQFDANGSGLIETPVPELLKSLTKEQTMSRGFDENGILHTRFNWTVETSQAGEPVLVVNSPLGSILNDHPIGQFAVGKRNFSFKREVNFLTIQGESDLGPMFPPPPIILKR
jgi:hypothetical protein